MEKRGIVFWLLVVVTIIGLAASLRILIKRAAYEKANRTVQIAIDLPSLTAQLPPEVDADSVVKRLGEIGVTSYGVYEFKAKELFANHDILFYRAWPEVLSSVGDGGDNPGNVVLRAENPWAAPVMESYMKAYFGGVHCGKDSEGRGFCLIPDIGDKVQDLTFGLHQTGLDVNVVPRFFNTPFENEKTIAEKMKALDGLKPGVIVFDGETALGFPKLLDVTQKELEKRPGWSIGIVDMVEQNGVKQLSWKLPGRVIPIHSVSDKEMAKNPPEKALTRFRRAVRERGIRFLYVRLYTPDFYGKDAAGALEENMDFIQKLADGIKSDGYTVGEAKPLTPFIVSRPMRAACVAGAVALAGLLCWIGFGLPGVLALIAAAGSFVIVMFLPETGGLFKYFIKLAALGIACAAPGFAVSLMFLRNKPDADGLVKFGVVEATARWAVSCALTLAGGFFVAAMLSEREYFLRMNVFSGVKIAFLIPLIIVFFTYLKSTGEKLSEFFDSPMRYVEVAIGVVAVGVLAVYLLRSGNQPGPGTMTDQESALRTALESLFFARPRFKEFLIGHPAMLLAGLIPFGKKRYIGLGLIMLGVMGQVSMLNSFCHLHTPIVMTYLRTVIGMILGLVIGLGLRVFCTAALWVFSKK